MKTQKTKLAFARLTLCELTAPELSAAPGGQVYETIVRPSDACGVPTSK